MRKARRFQKNKKNTLAAFGVYEDLFMMRIKADAMVGVLHTPHAEKWEFEVQVYGRRYIIR